MSTRHPTGCRIGSLCSGYGGLDLAALDVFGGTVAWHCEHDPDSKDGGGAAKVLAARWPGVPNHGDLTAIDWTAVEPIDVLTAGFPCQDLSYAGRGAGISEGNRSGLWYQVARAIGVLRPGLVLLENVDAIVGRRPGLDVVLSSLAGLGFDADWCVVPASAVGAPHRRARWFCVAWPTADAANVGYERGREARERRAGLADGSVTAADADRAGGQARGRRPRAGNARRLQPVECGGTDWGAYGPAVARWAAVLGRPAPAPTEPGRTGQRLAPRFVEWMQGLPAGWVTDVSLSRTAQLKVLGNGCVPQQAAAAYRMLLGALAMAA